MRLVVLNVDGTPQVIKSLFKVNVGNCNVDNFSNGSHGNLIRPIDINTGNTGVAIGGVGPEFLRPRLDAHWYENFQVPEWFAVVAFVKRVSSILPAARLQHFDVALADHGPKILEINDLGATRFHQLQGQGFITDEIRQALKNMHGTTDYLRVKRCNKFIKRLKQGAVIMAALSRML